MKTEIYQTVINSKQYNFIVEYIGLGEWIAGSYVGNVCESKAYGRSSESAALKLVAFIEAYDKMENVKNQNKSK